MKKLEVLGAGCPKCKKLYEMTELAAKETGIEYQLVKVEDMQQILDYGVMMTPALVVDGEVKAAGRVLAMDELKNLIS